MSAGPEVAVVTVVHGRHAHLERQLWGLRRQTARPDLHVVVAMDDPEVASVVADSRPAAGRTLVREIAGPERALPLAAARNLGASAALGAGADHLVFLDVDCIPSPGLVERYTGVLQRQEATGSAVDAAGEPTTDPRPCVLAGEVAYLPPPPSGCDYRDLDLDGLAAPHEARPTLRRNEIREASDLRLFWSLSFALDAASWETVGGFDEAYVGYGAEDTDFGQRLGRVGGRLLWVGGARSHHQFHPTSSPPVQHLHDIVANANRFSRRWGWWPMEGWLAAFADEGLARRRPDGYWEVTPSAGRATRHTASGRTETGADH